MTALLGLFLAACALLALGGAAKLVQPSPTAQALRAVGWPSHPVVVRVMGLTEAVIGVGAAVTAHPLAAAAVGAAYLGFTGFVVLAMARGSALESCGCFGKVDTPPSVAHIIVDVGAAGIAALVAFEPMAGTRTLLSAQPAAGWPLILWVGVTVYLLYLTLTALPRLTATLRGRT